VVTSAGGAALDLYQHLVRRDLGEADATGIARRMILAPHVWAGRRRLCAKRRIAHDRLAGLTRDIGVYTLTRMEPVESACVCTSLRMATRSVNRLYNRALSPVGLRVTGYSIMSRLAEEGPLSISELAGRLAMERTTCTREVAPLVESGLVEITVGSDRRRRVLRLTSLGVRKRAEAHPLWEGVQRMVANEFGDAAVSDLLARLSRLRESSDSLSIT
jgi:DNA-binding MarR family transcriptional regulator